MFQYVAYFKRRRFRKDGDCNSAESHGTEEGHSPLGHIGGQNRDFAAGAYAAADHSFGQSGGLVPEIAVGE